MTIHISVCYEGKYGVVTDLGDDFQLRGWPNTPSHAAVDLMIPRYGVWKLDGAKGKHEVVLTTNDLEAAKACADATPREEWDRKMKLWEHGGEECFGCGRMGYEQDMIRHEGKTYCEDCAPEADFAEVVKALHALSIPSAEVVATGGNIDCVRIVTGNYALYFGTASDDWGFSVYTINSKGEEEWGSALCEADSNFSTGMSSSERDSGVVAVAIELAVKRFEKSHGIVEGRVL